MTDALPKLRADLRLHEGAGGAAWIIEDPLRNKFFQIDAKAFAILCLWEAGSADAILRAAERPAGESISPEDVAALSEFLVRNGLTEMAAFGDFGGLAARLAAQKSSWLEFAVHHYLFFRIPLIRPGKFLQRTLPVFGVIFSRSMFLAVGFISIIGFYFASRQWDAFVSTFLYFFNLDGVALYALCLVIVKSAHEFGHAYMATRYGVRVGTMGVAFLVLMPVLYTDVTGAWKLRSRKQRLLITSAGMIAELMIAGLAVFIWAFAPDGPLRSAAFFMAVVSLGTSLLLNLNPFMRFDGYYLLSDAIGIANLQTRAFALGRWRLRRLLFGLKAQNPDNLSPALTNFCIVYAYAVWAYRLILFTGIALYVYHFFIKAAGIILFLIEIGAFILWPICKECLEWWKARRLIVKEPRFLLTAACILLAAAAFCLPISRSVRVPAILRAQTEIRIFAPRPAAIAAIFVQEGAPVEKGQLLFEMRSPQLEQDIALTRQKIAALAIRLARRPGDGEDRSGGLVLEHQLAAEKDKLAGLQREIAALKVRSPVTGIAADLHQAIHAGRFVDLKEPLAIIRGTDAAIVEGYAAEDELWRLELGAGGHFIPEDASLKGLPVRLASIAYAASDTLDIAYLASVYGGSIAIKPAGDKKLRPVHASYRVTMLVDAPPFRQVTRGSVHLTVKGESLAGMLATRVIRVFIREAGF